MCLDVFFLKQKPVVEGIKQYTEKRNIYMQIHMHAYSVIFFNIFLLIPTGNQEEMRTDELMIDATFYLQAKPEMHPVLNDCASMKFRI